MPEPATKQELTPNVQVRLALERTRAAYERTMMAWIRTATSLISFGFGFYKFFQLELKVAGRENQRIGVQEFALLMVGAGILAMVLGISIIGATCAGSGDRIQACLALQRV